MIAIVNYNMGNLQSVANMLNYLGASSQITSVPAEIAAADKIILPGVGAFHEAMANLRQLGLVAVLRQEVLEKSKPFLGICLGLQLIADKGYEGGETAGLSFIPGEVVKMEPNDRTLRIPHMGWNDVTPCLGTKMYGADQRPRVFYFVHSYCFIPKVEADISGTVEYGGAVVASLERGNIWATQFHPEKSQKDGIELLKNFLGMPA